MKNQRLGKQDFLKKGSFFSLLALFPAYDRVPALQVTDFLS
ncbi:MAG: hypothetical protein ACI86H_001513 [bacterium]|jgi:hypothetical protein